jgi:nucleoside-diphosphate-sugar epimerase
MTRSARRVLITGAGGFLGRFVAQSLVRAGHQVVALSRERRAAEMNVRWVKCDLLDESQHRQAIQEARADTLVHLAWCTEHGSFWGSPGNFAWTKATLSLVQQFAQNDGSRAFVAGTCAEYDWNYGYCVEGVTPANPRTVYGTCKDATRRLVEAVAASAKMQFAWGRIFFPFGPGEPAERLIPSVIRSLLSGDAVRCSHGMQYRDFLYAEDAGEAIAHLACGTEASGVFNISSGEPTRIAAVVNHCVERIRPDAKPDFGAVQAPADDPPMLVGDNERLRSTGWRQRISWQEGVSRMVDQLRGQGQAWTT